MQTTLSVLVRNALVAVALVILGACSSEATNVVSESADAPDTVDRSQETTPVTSPEPVEVPTTEGPVESDVIEVIATTSTTLVPDVEAAAEDMTGEEVAVDDTGLGDIGGDVNADASRAAPPLDQLVEDLESQTSVPLRLPSRLTNRENGELFAEVVIADENLYVVSIGLDPSCVSSACSRGTLTGTRATDGPLERVTGGVPVPLPNGGEGRFFDASCGANCGDAYVVWYEGDIEYGIGIRVGSGPDVLDWVWSALDPDASPPRPPEQCEDGVDLGEGRLMSVVLADAATDMHWVVLCGPDGVQSEVLAGHATPRLVTSGYVPLVALVDDSGQSTLFGGAIPLLDYSEETFWAYPRLTIGELRCRFASGAVDLLADAETGLVFNSSGNAYDSARDGAVDIDALEPC